MARIVINNTAVRNNGDVALVTALAGALARRGHRVAIATPHPVHAVQVQSLENVCPDVRGFLSKRFRRPWLAGLAAICLLAGNRTYRECDVLIGAPGGYLNSRYGPLGWRLAVYRWASLCGKRTAIYSQSIDGLLPADARVLRRCARSLDVLLARDEASLGTARACGIPDEKLMLTDDALFLDSPAVSPRSGSSRVVGISVRDWKHGGGNRAGYLAMMARIATQALEEGFNVDFFSTCQGVPGYIDDSRVAREVAGLIPDGVAAGRVTVTGEAMNLEQLRQRIEGCHLVVGTRLHMCLLAIMRGVPAFNVSYEPKGRECFRYLGLEPYSVDYHESPQKAAEAFRAFLADRDAIRRQLPAVVQARHERAVTSLDQFLQRMGID